MTMLVLFKPFTSFTNIYNSISWNDSFQNFGENSKFVSNIEEMRIEEKKTHQNSNEVDGTDIDPDDPDNDVFVSDAINDEDSCHIYMISSFLRKELK